MCLCGVARTLLDFTLAAPEEAAIEAEADSFALRLGVRVARRAAKGDTRVLSCFLRMARLAAAQDGWLPGVVAPLVLFRLPLFLLPLPGVPHLLL